MKQVGNWFKPQYIIPLAIVAGVIYLIFKFKDIFKGAASTNNTVDFKTKQVDLANMNLIADIQQEAMGSLGTNTDTLFNSLDGLNPDELKAVFNAFGKRNYAYGMNMGGSLGLFGDKLNLIQWYQNELSGTDLNKMKAIWKKANIIF